MPSRLVQSPTTSESRASRETTIDFWIVVALTTLAVAIHVYGYLGRPLWSDEASTYWTTRAGALGILAGERCDGTPPLYFLVVLLSSSLFGSSEVALRLPSLLAAVALVPGLWVTTRAVASRRSALIAAALAAVSPLLHYYSVEARNYALLQLETVLVVGAAWRAMQAPGRWGRWMTLGGLQTLQVLTHIYAAFLLPVPALAIALAFGRKRLPVVARAVATAVVAFLIGLPWLLLGIRNSAEGVGDWIAPVWRQTPPSLAVIRSLEAFGFGGAYPDYLAYLSTASTVRVASWTLTVVVLAANLLVRRRDERWRERASVLGAGLLVPLLGAWCVSSVSRPIYVVGRYDTMVLPIFLMMFATGLNALRDFRSWAGWIGLALTAGLITLTHITTLGQSVPADPDVDAADYLVRYAHPEESVITTGLRRPVVAYYLERAGRVQTLLSYPVEMARHPGWISAERLLSEPARLEQDAQSIVAAARGRRAWVLLSGRNQVDQSLRSSLLSHFDVDEAASRRDLSLFALVPRE